MHASGGIRSLFITGASGFIGRRLLRRLDAGRYDRIYCLTRQADALAASVAARPNVTILAGGLDDTQVYAPHLASVDVVVHLAARTGKARAAEYFQVNAQGTERLVRECERAAVPGFLYVSSIATKFSDARAYHYARSKREGEDIVRRSTLTYTIVRPTLVIGPEAPLWQRLESLAAGPVTAIVGDGTARLQPIYVDDLVDGLIAIIEGDIFHQQTLDIGGPEVITMEELLRRIHHRRFRKDPRVLHLPFAPVVRILSLLERPLFALLPVTAGQLSSFANDGTVDPPRAFVPPGPPGKTVDEMLSLVASHA